MRETGTATLGIMVVRGFLRNTKTTRTTSNIEMIMVFSISRTDARMVTV